MKTNPFSASTAVLLIGALLPGAAPAGAETVETGRAAELISQGAMIIDVRTPEEVEVGTIAGALTIPHDQTDRLKAVIGRDRRQPVVLYCSSGRRVGTALEALEQAGYDTGALVNGGGYEALNQALAAMEK